MKNLPFALFCALMVVIGFVAIHSRTRPAPRDFGPATQNFVDQVNKFDANAQQNDLGQFQLERPDADELILVPYACPLEEIEARFGDRPAGFRSELLAVARNQTAASLVWLKDGEIISVNPARLNPGTNVALQVWKLGDKQPLTVRAAPTEKSPAVSVPSRPAPLLK